MMGSIYFSHPIGTYATPEAQGVLQALQRAYPGYKILDPEDVDPEGPGASCQECMKNHMRKCYFPLIEKCSIFALWAPLATCGIECELHYAWQLGKPVVFASYTFGEVDFEDMTLRDYHYMEVATEVV